MKRGGILAGGQELGWATHSVAWGGAGFGQGNHMVLSTKTRAGAACAGARRLPTLFTHHPGPCSVPQRPLTPPPSPPPRHAGEAAP